MTDAPFAKWPGACDYCGGLDPYTVFLGHAKEEEWACEKCAAADEGRSSETLDERTARYQAIYRKETG